MQQRGRKTEAQLTALAHNVDQPCVQPPSSLSVRGRRLFTELAAGSAPRHFVPSDAPLLANYCEAILLAQAAAKRAARSPAAPTALQEWERVTRTVALLATKLRLSPQSRTDPKTVGRHPPLTGPHPWDDGRDDDK